MSAPSTRTPSAVGEGGSGDATCVAQLKTRAGMAPVPLIVTGPEERVVSSGYYLTDRRN